MLKRGMDPSALPNDTSAVVSPQLKTRRELKQILYVVIMI